MSTVQPANQVLPLTGVRVVEVCDIWVGPGVGTMLGAMGAEVIKLESVQRRSISRGLSTSAGPNPVYPDMDPGDRPWNRNSYFNYHNHDKLGVTLDLSRPRGVELFKDLVKTVDVVIENFYSNMLPKLGVHYEAIREARPDLIMLSMPPYGSTGPYKDHVTYGFLIDAACGHASLRGYPDREVSEVPAAFLQDPAGISLGVFAVVSALRHRTRTGEGQHVEMAQMEAFIPRIGDLLLDYSMNGRAARPVGNRHPVMAPHGAYPCQGEDRWITIAVAADEEWRALCEVIDRPGMAEAYPDAQARFREQETIDTAITAWTSGRTDYDAMHALQRAGVRAGVVMDIPQLHQDPHLAERGVFQDVTHPEAGTHHYFGTPWHMSHTSFRIGRPAPLLGEDNDYVFGEVLGLPQAELDQLQAEDYLGDTPLEAR